MTFKDRVYAYQQLQNEVGTYANGSIAVYIGTTIVAIETDRETIFINKETGDIFTKYGEANILLDVDQEAYRNPLEVEEVLAYFGVTPEFIGSHNIYTTTKYTYFIPRVDSHEWFRKPRRY